jgi:hypothetical protein
MMSCLGAGDQQLFNSLLDGLHLSPEAWPTDLPVPHLMPKIEQLSRLFK